jgi:tetratricopeptide (TPR) repeat protein
MSDGCAWCRYDACCKMLQKALVYYRKSSQVLSAARAERALGTVLQTMARLSEAEPLLRNALGVFKAQAAEGVEVAVSYDCLASLQAAPVSSRARASRASRLLARASTQAWTCTAALRASSRRANPSMELSPGRSLLQISKGELPEAHESLQLALAICDRELDTTSPVLGDVLYRLGCVHLMLRDRKDSLESSEKFLQRALAIAEQQCAARVASWHSAAAAVGPPARATRADETRLCLRQVRRCPSGRRARAVPVGRTVHRDGPVHGGRRQLRQGAPHPRGRARSIARARRADAEAHD